MIEIRLLTLLNQDDLVRLVKGYTSHTKYHVRKTESAYRIVFSLELVPLPEPYHKRYDHLDTETLDHYRQLPALSFSFSAYDQEQCVGILLAEPRPWNKSLWVWELHVSETHQQRGIGRRLIEALTEKGRAAGLRTIVCETQNTNVPAIQFYRQAGFTFEGIDLSYYSNEDYPDGEIAIFLKKKIV